MITEDQLEQLAIQWFQDTGWNYVHGAVIAPEGVAAEREALRTLAPALPRARGRDRLSRLRGRQSFAFSPRNPASDLTAARTWAVEVLSWEMT